ncbi:MAG: tRNA glutamyl-Q(34) synthetase GluQRS [Gammaproteobacteria bacterium]
MPRSTTMPFTTRFAPSPTGELHLGHVYAALFAHQAARDSGGRFLVRMEDLDTIRCRTDYATAIMADLQWLGLSPAGPVLYQSTRLATYQAALDQLKHAGLVYPCFCTRGDIARELDGLTAAPHGPDGPLYPGTCRRLSVPEREDRLAAGTIPAWRLDTALARSAVADRQPAFEETGRGPHDERGTIPVDCGLLGDVILGRKDFGASYHLAVVLDDAHQGVTLVTRGEDLFAATHVQWLLQAILALPHPVYRHHRLIRDAEGNRLAKRDHHQTLASRRAAGQTPCDLKLELQLG